MIVSKWVCVCVCLCVCVCACVLCVCVSECAVLSTQHYRAHLKTPSRLSALPSFDFEIQICSPKTQTFHTEFKEMNFRTSKKCPYILKKMRPSKLTVLVLCIAEFWSRPFAIQSFDHKTNFRDRDTVTAFSVGLVLMTVSRVGMGFVAHPEFGFRGVE